MYEKRFDQDEFDVNFEVDEIDIEQEEPHYDKNWKKPKKQKTIPREEMDVEEEVILQKMCK